METGLAEMDLDNKYELFEVLANDSESKTFNARVVASGRTVLVHVLFGGKAAPGKQKLLDLVLQRLVDASPERRGQILEISDYKGMPYAVTEVVPDFRNLRDWLEAERQPEPPPLGTLPPGSAAVTGERFAKSGKWVVPPLEPKPALRETPPLPTPGAPPGPPEKQPGEFTMLFRAAVPPPEPAPGPVKEAVPQPPKPAAQPELDEFDRLFQTPAQPTDVLTSPPEIPAGGPPPVRPQEPDEFTRLFHAAGPGSLPAEPLHEQPLQPPLPRPQPGEFTSLFQAAGPAPSPAGPQLPQPPGAAGEPGTFTRMFQSPAPVQPPSERLGAAPSSGQAPGEFTELLKAAAQSATPFVGPPAGGPPQGPQAPSGSRGEFTQMFGPGAGLGGRVQPPGAPAGPARPAHGGATGLFSTPQSGASPAAPAASGPGEYTRMFGTPPAGPSYGQPPPQTPAAPAAAPQPRQAQRPAASPGSSKLPLIILGVALLVVVVALVVYFLVSR